MINVGVSEKTVEAARAAVLEILNAEGDQKTKRLALRAFVDVCAVSNVQITDCTFTLDETEEA